MEHAAAAGGAQAGSGTQRAGVAAVGEGVGAHFVARQPILDRNQRVYAYELLFRSGPENVFRCDDPDQASGRVIETSASVFGLNALVGHGRAFINLTKRALVEEFIRLLPPDVAVVEVLETVEPTPDVVEACRNLSDAGYTLALDDFVFREGLEPLLELADIIKVDMLATRDGARDEMLRRLTRYKVALLAEKVETQADFHAALDAGFAYFQGYFFCKPEMVTRKEVPAFKLTYLRFLRELNRRELDYGELETLIRCDVALTYKLLRLVNSPFFGLRRELTSIRQALAHLGEQAVRKWASLLALSGLSVDASPEVLKMTLVRARVLELLAETTRRFGQSADLFLLGLLSTIDVIVGRPMQELLAEMAVPALVREGLLQPSSRPGQLFQLVAAFERGIWGRCDELSQALDLPPEVLPAALYKAVAWAEQMCAPALLAGGSDSGGTPPT